MEDECRKHNWSRRSVLKAVVVLAGAAAIPVVIPDAAAAQAKASKASVKYQDQPKNGQRCSGCVQFIAGGQCKIVEGSISPNGWCTAFAPKS